MDHPVTSRVLPAPSALLLGRLWPLWRHLAFSAAMFCVLATGALVRLDVQRLRKDLDRSSRLIVEARILNDRLGLEMEARRRAVAMEAAAAELGLGPAARLETLRLDAVPR